MCRSGANGRPGRVNTFISCRLTASTVEQETSSGMKQMKEQIIPSPWMTCSSDPESEFASLAPPQSTLGAGGSANARACSHFIFHNWEKICCEMMSDRCGNTNGRSGTWRGRWPPTYAHSSRTSGTQAASSLFLFPAPHPPSPGQWSSICSRCPVCLSQRLLADLPLT